VVKCWLLWNINNMAAIDTDTVIVTNTWFRSSLAVIRQSAKLLWMKFSLNVQYYCHLMVFETSEKSLKIIENYLNLFLKLEWESYGFVQMAEVFDVLLLCYNVVWSRLLRLRWWSHVLAYWDVRLHFASGWWLVSVSV